MHGHTQLAPHYFFRQQRLLRALLIDDQAWFVLDDFSRLLDLPCPNSCLPAWMTIRHARKRCIPSVARTRHSG
ncbi:hypothetical protein [Pseudomonas paraeruginosa]|uniref:hypothetical protein n=1 Tax=Pseudomonas paraeruginosa TaxID=2994495 RepID=UPI001950D32E|nr:hypothetical protein [Pseudomonas paraeruginosa]